MVCNSGGMFPMLQSHDRKGAVVFDFNHGLLWDYERPRNFFIESCQYRAVGQSQSCKMAVPDLSSGSRPFGKLRDIVIVREKTKAHRLSPLQAKEKLTSLDNGEAVLRNLSQHPHEPQFNERTGQQLRTRVRKLIAHPRSNSLVKLMLKHSQRHKGVYVQQMTHGKLARISSTCSLVSVGAPGPPLKTGSPVKGSAKILGFRECVRRSINTMRSPSRLTSRASPARKPSLRRIALGSTT